MPRKANEVSYTVVVRFGTPKSYSWIRHGVVFGSILDADIVVKEYGKQSIKAIVKRTSLLDTVGMPDGWNA